jgi:hypothetical protein
MNNKSAAGEMMMKEKPNTQDFLEAIKRAGNIEAFARENVDSFMDVTFKDYLGGLLAAKKVKKSAVIKASGLPDSYAFQIFQGLKSPSRDKLIALAIGLRTNLEECQRLLKLAGVNELYAKNRRDAIIIFALENGLGIPELNDILFNLDEFTL